MQISEKTGAGKITHTAMLLTANNRTGRVTTALYGATPSVYYINTPPVKRIRIRDPVGSCKNVEKLPMGVYLLVQSLLFTKLLTIFTEDNQR
jgi:hypothetical protein